MYLLYTHMHHVLLRTRIHTANNSEHLQVSDTPTHIPTTPHTHECTRTHLVVLFVIIAASSRARTAAALRGTALALTPRSVTALALAPRPVTALALAPRAAARTLCVPMIMI